MTEFLNEIEQALADLLQAGFSTGGPAVPRMEQLARQCEDRGLHTGARLLGEIGAALSARAHALEKEDLPLAAAVCRAVCYVGLCREKLQEDVIAERWLERTAAGADRRKTGGTL